MPRGRIVSSINVHENLACSHGEIVIHTEGCAKIMMLSPRHGCEKAAYLNKAELPLHSSVCGHFDMGSILARVLLVVTGWLLQVLSFGRIASCNVRVRHAVGENQYHAIFNFP